MSDLSTATPTAPPSPRSGPALPLVPLLLLLLALGDLQIELRLLLDRFTFTSLIAAIGSHWLAVAVLLFQPSLWRHYRRRGR